MFKRVVVLVGFLWSSEEVPAHLAQLALDWPQHITDDPISPHGAPFPTLEVCLLLQCVESQILRTLCIFSFRGFLGNSRVASHLIIHAMGGSGGP